jgi:hypothetical protein
MPEIKTMQIYVANEPVVVEFSGAPAHSDDWVAVSKAGETAETYVCWASLHEQANGTVTLPGVAAGQYEARLFVAPDNRKIAAGCTFSVEKASNPYMVARALGEVSEKSAVVRYAQVFKGTSDSDVAEVSLVRVGAPGDNLYLLKFGGTFEHEWNGKIVLHRKSQCGNQGNFTTLVDGDRSVTISTHENQHGGVTEYVLWLQDNDRNERRRSIPLHYDESLSRQSKPFEILQEYLNPAACAVRALGFVVMLGNAIQVVQPISSAEVFPNYFDFDLIVGNRGTGSAILHVRPYFWVNDTWQEGAIVNSLPINLPGTAAIRCNVRTYIQVRGESGKTSNERNVSHSSLPDPLRIRLDFMLLSGDTLTQEFVYKRK